MSTSPRDTVGVLLSRTGRVWRTRLDERLEPLGLTQARWLVLMHLARMGGEAPQKELAQSVGVESPTMVRVVDGLERLGLVERVGQKDDRRAKKVRLTHKAQGVNEEIQRIGSGLRAEALAGLSDEELAEFLRILEIILNNLCAAAVR